VKPALHTPAAVKTERQRTLLEIVQKRAVRTQEEIADELTRHGFHATQATVSRDIRELGLIRTPHGDGMRYVQNGGGAHPAPTRLTGVLRDHLLDLEFVGNVGVLHTRSPTAALVAAAIDAAAFAEVVGTVAGDDTVMVVVRTPAGGQRLAKHLASLVGEG
jgi:transcriptional regulator of arginine metabolism